ncbi:MAG TPA: YhcH/YjgK/YiaL family protein [Tepidisphaeraceae bacterium]|jgi:YhcH/YjgK/YiaL family protein
MILDRLSNALLYQFANPLIQRGVEFLQSVDVAVLPLGRTDIDGEKLFALTQEYQTREESGCDWEAHRKYIDIQFIVDGRERIDYAPSYQLQMTNPYDAEKDRSNFKGEGSALILSAGMFAIFFPEDAHRPCVAADSVNSVRKIVIKVAVLL